MERQIEHPNPVEYEWIKQNLREARKLLGKEEGGETEAGSSPFRGKLSLRLRF